MHTCNSRTLEMEAGRSAVQGYPLLHREFEASHAGLQDAVTNKTKQKPIQEGDYAVHLKVF